VAKDSITDRWDESSDHLSISAPECHRCKHYGGDMTCLAFPDGIPDAIMGQVVLHREPYPGDNGVVFEEA
jgi:hypothetical protein